MKKITSLLLCALLLCASLCGCGGEKSYADGTYTAQSSVYINDDGTDDGNGYGVVTLTIKDNTITECSFQSYEEDGTLKDEEYGKERGEIANRDFYNKAQKAVAACDEYAKTLVSLGMVSNASKEIDAISGATVNHDNFCEAVEIALEQAEN